jgi:hypothetical protein
VLEIPVRQNNVGHTGTVRKVSTKINFDLTKLLVKLLVEIMESYRYQNFDFDGKNQNSDKQ